MVHLTIVLPLSIKAASYGSTNIKDIKGSLWSTNSRHENLDPNQSNHCGFCANKVEAHGSHINAADKLISRLCCCCNRLFIRRQPWPGVAKAVQSSTQNRCHLEGRQKTGVVRQSLCFASRDSSFTDSLLLTQHGKNTAVCFCLFF